MNIVVDTSAVMAVLTNEPHKAQLRTLTRGASLISPASLPWEIGNAFSAMFKRGRASILQAEQAIDTFREISIRLVEVDLEQALRLSKELDIYAYDAYMISSALDYKCAFLSLDKALQEAARRMKIRTLEIES